MDDPTAEVIISVAIKVKVTDTGLNESKAIDLDEYVVAPPGQWELTYAAAVDRVNKEMRAMVAALEVERSKTE